MANLTLKESLALVVVEKGLLATLLLLAGGWLESQRDAWAHERQMVETTHSQHEALSLELAKQRVVVATRALEAGASLYASASDFVDAYENPNAGRAVTLALMARMNDDSHTFQKAALQVEAFLGGEVQAEVDNVQRVYGEFVQLCNEEPDDFVPRARNQQEKLLDALVNMRGAIGRGLSATTLIAPDAEGLVGASSPP